MDRLSRHQRLQIVEMFYQHNGSVRRTYRALRPFYGTFTRPSARTIRLTVDSFRTTPTLNEIKMTVQPARRQRVCNEQTVAAVQRSIKENPDQTIRSRSQQLGLSPSTLWKILRKDLGIQANTEETATKGRGRKAPTTTKNTTQSAEVKVKPTTLLEVKKNLIEDSLEDVKILENKSKVTSGRKKKQEEHKIAKNSKEIVDYRKESLKEEAPKKRGKYSFRSTATINYNVHPVRPHTVCTEQVLVAVQQSFKENPTQSIRSRSQQLGIRPSTLWKILRKDLGLQANKRSGRKAPTTKNLTESKEVEATTLLVVKENLIEDFFEDVKVSENNSEHEQEVKNDVKAVNDKNANNSRSNSKKIVDNLNDSLKEGTPKKGGKVISSTEQVLAAVQQSIKENPNQTIRSRSQQLGMSPSTLWNILRKQLRLQANKQETVTETKGRGRKPSTTKTTTKSEEVEATNSLLVKENPIEDSKDSNRKAPTAKNTSESEEVDDKTLLVKENSIEDSKNKGRKAPTTKNTTETEEVKVTTSLLVEENPIEEVEEVDDKTLLVKISIEDSKSRGRKASTTKNTTESEEVVATTLLLVEENSIEDSKNKGRKAPTTKNTTESEDVEATNSLLVKENSIEDSKGRGRKAPTTKNTTESEEVDDKTLLVKEISIEDSKSSGRKASTTKNATESEEVVASTLLLVEENSIEDSKSNDRKEPTTKNTTESEEVQATTSLLVEENSIEDSKGRGRKAPTTNNTSESEEVDDKTLLVKENSIEDSKGRGRKAPTTKNTTESEEVEVTTLLSVEDSLEDVVSENKSKVPVRMKRKQEDQNDENVVLNINEKNTRRNSRKMVENLNESLKAADTPKKRGKASKLEACVATLEDKTETKPLKRGRAEAKLAAKPEDLDEITANEDVLPKKRSRKTAIVDEKPIKGGRGRRNAAKIQGSEELETDGQVKSDT